MNTNKKIRYTLTFLALFAALILFLILNICIGSVRISLKDVLDVFINNSSNEKIRTIVMDIRFPRAVSAVILGGALSLSGYLLQTFFHNPIAGPFVLGISSGAKMCVAIVMVFLAGSSVMINSATLIIAAFAGSMISMGFVLLMTKRARTMARLIVCGIMIGYICSALTELIVSFAGDADIVNLHNWSRGSFSGMTWENVTVMAIVVFITFVITFLLSKPFDAYLLGDSYASNMGVNIKLLRVMTVILSGILSACIVAFAGPVSFVGIAAPHLVRKMFNTGKPIVMIPACFLSGSVFCLFCDLLARNILAPTELNISTVTAIFGAPIVIIILLNNKKEGH